APVRSRLSGMKWSCVHHRWPTSLERQLSRRQVAAVFPAMYSPVEGFPVPWIGWIPDFQHKRLPHFFQEAESQHRDTKYRKLIDDCTHLVVSSKDARKDLMEWFPTDPNRVSVLPFVSVSAPEWYQDSPKDVAAEFKLPSKYLIFPSQFWVHKNHWV